MEKNFVDSHGQSEVAFAFCHLLGTVRLMPRLKRIKYERLYLPEKRIADDYPNLAAYLPAQSAGTLSSSSTMRWSKRPWPLSATLLRQRRF